jgi:hypothetical protein
VARVADRYGEAVARRRVNLRCGSGHRCLPWRRCGRAPSTSPTRRSLLSITGRYAIALYPDLDRLTDATADPQQIISMIIALHSATPDIADLTPSMTCASVTARPSVRHLCPRNRWAPARSATECYLHFSDQLLRLVGERREGRVAPRKPLTAPTVSPASWRSRCCRCSECVRGRLPLPEALGDELGPLLRAPAVEHLEV